MDPPSSSITFASSSSYLSNGSSPCSVAALPPGALAPPLPGAEGWGGGGASSSVDAASLNRLSKNLERLLLDPDLHCSDADVDMEDGGPLVPVHRCILAARSPFFYEFVRRSRGDGLLSASASGGGGGGEGTGRPQYKMEELVPGGRVGREAFLEFMRYLYTGKLRPAPADVVSCADHACPHDSCPPAIRFAVELMYAAWTFKISDLIVVFQRRLLNFVDKTLAEDVLPILQVAFHSELPQVLEKCVQRIARSDLDSISLDKELPLEIADEIKKIRQNSPSTDGDSDTIISDPVHEKRVRRIHRALDSDDVELVKLLLNESEITLDDAYALHYAAAYCDSKVVTELLDLRLANLNLKNSRGYTSLHLAAMRREPAIIMCLLSKGAVASQLTDDGRLASNICRRLTRLKDYNTKMEQRQESNKDRMCIDILEREMMRNHMIVEDSVTSPLLADDLQMKLTYLENRVALARFFFPAEAKVAMHIAQADITPEVDGVSAASTSGKLKEVDLNETPVTQNKRLRSRVDALMKTVELGRRYFPNCSQVLEKILEDDLSDGFDVFHQQNSTPDEKKVKKMRLGELKEDVRKAFSKDKADNSAYSALSSNSSSSPSSPPEMATKK